ncbi:MAG TPA: GNAT family N-acetyltransferase [Actinomycetes bacterium]|jgi:GNAT superfamily N-acetyltransferase|nr:GNAT family N-acetyltransferase [Actinomycetes bacterium]
MGIEVTIVELPSGSPWWRDGGLDTLRMLRPGLEEALLRRVLVDGAREGLRYHGAVVDGRCQAIAGWRLMTTTVFGRCAYVDDLVVDAESRSAGIGRRLLAFVAEEATRLGATTLTLDSAVQRAAAHRFYYREGLHVAAFHFIRQLQGTPPRLG